MPMHFVKQVLTYNQCLKIEFKKGERIYFDLTYMSDVCVYRKNSILVGDSGKLNLKENHKIIAIDMLFMVSELSIKF